MARRPLCWPRAPAPSKLLRLCSRLGLTWKRRTLWCAIVSAGAAARLYLKGCCVDSGDKLRSWRPQPRDICRMCPHGPRAVLWGCAHGRRNGARVLALSIFCCTLEPPRSTPRIRCVGHLLHGTPARSSSDCVCDAAWVNGAYARCATRAHQRGAAAARGAREHGTERQRELAALVRPARVFVCVACAYVLAPPPRATCTLPFMRRRIRHLCHVQAGLTACDIAAAEGHADLSDVLYVASSQLRPKHSSFATV